MTQYERARDDQNGWNLFFSILFAVLLIASAWMFWNRFDGFPSRINAFDALLIALAVFRATRLLVYDKITRFLREWFMVKKEMTRDDGTTWVSCEKPSRGPRAAISDLLACPWCVGVWVSLAIVYGYFMFSWGWYVVFILAVAGTSSFIQILINKIGWNAEKLKHEAQELGHGHHPGAC